MRLDFSHQVKYLIQHDVKVYAIAQSLVANDDIVKMLPKILERMCPGLLIDELELQLKLVTHSSLLREEFNGSLSGKFQASLEDLIGAVGKATGLNALERNKTAISGLIILMLIVGALYVFEKRGKDSIVINGDYNTVITTVSQNFGLDRHNVEQIIKSTLNERDKRALARDAADFVAPAKPGGSVHIEGVGTLNEDSIEAMPDHEQIDALENDEISKTRENIEIHVRALDLDQARRGWAGMVKLGDEQRRVRMVIVPGIDLETLKAQADLGPLVGDVEIFYKRDRQGEWRPYVMHLYRVRATESSKVSNEEGALNDQKEGYENDENSPISS